jgi:hypothetical protein
VVEVRFLTEGERRQIWYVAIAGWVYMVYYGGGGKREPSTAGANEMAKKRRSRSQQLLFDDVSWSFSDHFLQDHAGRIITDPRIAIIEIIANAFDAGATVVEIHWPDKIEERLSITDNGTGMTLDEFEKRWTTFNYQRVEEQGSIVEFPPGVTKYKRFAFGHSGKGRYAPFCYADSYSVETTKGGRSLTVDVALTPGGNRPFRLSKPETTRRKGHGTKISAVITRNLLDADELRQLIGTKFLVDPSFTIQLNGTSVKLLELDGIETQVVPVPPHGDITIHFFDTTEHGRTSRLRGITWWARGRRVGEPNWDRLDDEGAYLDGRSEEGKRYSFVVEVDFLDTKADWTDFHADQKSQDVKAVVHHFVLNKLRALTADNRKERKLQVLKYNRGLLGELPRVSQVAVSHFVDEIQDRCPGMSDRDLQRVVEILSRLEQSRWQYDLLKRLAQCSPQDLDTWNEIMRQWTATSADLVLGELHRRIRLIERMQDLVDNPHGDELHELQPLFERGLWIFGTEYESVDFRSNRGLKEVILRFLQAKSGLKGNANYGPPERRRTDIVAVAEPPINVYSADTYQAGKVAGIRKVLVLELKKGGYTLNRADRDQARDYAIEIRKSGRVQDNTELEVYLLGAAIGDHVGRVTEPDDRVAVTPMQYGTILREAELRTFNLQRELKRLGPAPMPDEEIDRVFPEEISILTPGQ